MGFFIYTNSDGDTVPRIKNIVVTVILVFAALVLFFSSIVTVPAGSVGVITRFGAVSRVAYPGVVVKIPFIEQLVAMDTRTQKDQVEVSAASRDLQAVTSKIAVNYHLIGQDAVTVYQVIGIDYQDKVIAPAIQEAFKGVTSKYTAEQLITSRELVRQEAQELLSARLSKYHVIVDNFNIVNFDFSADFNNAIEQKQVAQQNLEKAKIEAQTAITQAQGQADAQKVLKDTGSLTPEYLRWLELQIVQQKWNGSFPLSVNGSGPILSIPTTK